MPTLLSRFFHPSRTPSDTNCLLPKRKLLPRYTNAKVHAPLKMAARVLKAVPA